MILEKAITGTNLSPCVGITFALSGLWSCFGYPLSIFFIVINEFCERFSYYGMRGNSFRPCPVRWKATIVSLSIVYTIGQAVIAVSSINDLTDFNHDGTPDSISAHVALSMVGLALIALGTGGIKPCVSAFGGDQFEEGQEKQRNRFFSIFYLAINAGSLISTIITPLLRVVFVIGSRMYKKFQPQGNVMAKVVRCIGFAIKNRFRHRSKEFPKREHWLDWANEKYDERLVSQIKMVTRVMFLYIPLPMFWALFDQQGIIEIQPDQMQTVNAILIVIMVPIMDALVYPLIAKCGFNFTPLKKMTVGMFLASMAFVAAAVVQVEIDTNDFMTFDVDKLTSINISSAGSLVTPVTHSFEQGHRHTLLVWAPNHHRVVKDGLNQKPVKGENGIRFVNTFDESFNVTMNGEVYVNVASHNASEYQFFPSGVKSFTINSAEISQQCENDFKSSYLEYGSAYTYVIARKNDGCPEVKIFEDIAPNTVNMALQIPQYFLLTCGEVVFSVTGLEFSYSQAPSNMKSVLQAGWLLTVAVGNIIVLIVAGAGQFSEQWAEYVLFAALLLVVCVIFAIMARFYTYINPAEIEAQFDEDEKKKYLEKSNPYPKSDSFSQTQM
ncbi:solute carrier family 15 member 1 [Camelus ferus]|nr:solute carrier family 15 member 1 [Camelus ferus]